MTRVLRLPAAALLIVLALTGFAAAPAGASAAPAASAACSGSTSFVITSFAFSPPSVSPGQESTETVTAVNCGGQTVNTTLGMYARYAGTGTGIPPGCQAIDPIEYLEAVAPGGTVTQSLTFTTSPSCPATALNTTATFGGPNDTVLAQATASLTISQPVTPTPCHVVYTLNSQWQGGFNAQVAIENTGTAAINGWTLVFDYSNGQTVGNVWGATVSQSGAAVTLANLSYDGTIAPGATMTIGWSGGWSGYGNYAPTSFALNGSLCT